MRSTVFFFLWFISLSKIISPSVLLQTAKFHSFLWLSSYIYIWGFSSGSAGKEFACNVGDLGSIPGLGRCPGEGKGYPLQYSGLENSMGCIVCGAAKSWTWLSDFHFRWLYIYIWWMEKMWLCRYIVVELLSCVQLFATPWTIAHYAPLSLGFLRQKYWSGLLFPFLGDILDLGIEPTSSASPALAGNRKHSSADGHFFCYHIWAVNIAAMNTEVHANAITFWGTEVRMSMWVQPMTPRVFFKPGFLERLPLAWAPCLWPRILSRFYVSYTPQWPPHLTGEDRWAWGGQEKLCSLKVSMRRAWGSRGGADGLQEEAAWLLMLPGGGAAQKSPRKDYRIFKFSNWWLNSKYHRFPTHGNYPLLFKNMPF